MRVALLQDADVPAYRALMLEAYERDMWRAVEAPTAEPSTNP